MLRRRIAPLHMRAVRAAFSHTGENQVHSARALGITRNTMRTLLKRHGLLADAAVPPFVGDEPDPHAPLAH